MEDDVGSVSIMPVPLSGAILYAFAILLGSIGSEPLENNISAGKQTLIMILVMYTQLGRVLYSSIQVLE